MILPHAGTDLRAVYAEEPGLELVHLTGVRNAAEPRWRGVWGRPWGDCLVRVYGPEDAPARALAGLPPDGSGTLGAMSEKRAIDKMDEAAITFLPEPDCARCYRKDVPLRIERGRLVCDDCLEAVREQDRQLARETAERERREAERRAGVLVTSG